MIANTEDFKPSPQTNSQASRYSIRILTEKYIEEAMQLFKQDFNKYESIRAAYYKKFPERIPLEYYQYWDALKVIYRQEMFKKGLSIGCFDLQNNQELIGVTLAKDISITDSLSKEVHILFAFSKLQEQMNASVAPGYLELIGSKKIHILDQWLFVIKSQHNGRGLLHKMIAASDYLASKQNFQYSLCWASNFKTGKALKRLKYQIIGQVDAKLFQHQGIRYFEEIDEDMKIQTIWLKKLENIDENELPAKIDH